MDSTMTFSNALALIKQGFRLMRQGWNGKGMFVFLVPGSTFKVNRAPLLGIYPEGTEIRYHAHIDMRTADGQVVPWLCSQTDMLAEDWEIVNDRHTVAPADPNGIARVSPPRKCPDGCPIPEAMSSCPMAGHDVCGYDIDDD